MLFKDLLSLSSSHLCLEKLNQLLKPTSDPRLIWHNSYPHEERHPGSPTESQGTAPLAAPEPGDVFAESMHHQPTITAPLADSAKNRRQQEREAAHLTGASAVVNPAWKSPAAAGLCETLHHPAQAKL